MMKKIKYPKIDRSDFIPEWHRDAGYGEGTLKDGRPYRAECWFEVNLTCLTCFLPTVGIENYSAEDFKKLVVSEGLISFDDENFLSSGYSGDNVEAKKVTDASGNEMWSITVIIGDDDGTYADNLFKMKRYKFPYKVESKPEEYIIGLCEEDTHYFAYFINNSSEPIELMIEGGEHEYKDIESKSTIFVKSYFDWDFDWSNQINIYLKTGKKELYLGFLMKKYFPAWTDKVENIPVLNKSGWICK